MVNTAPCAEDRRQCWKLSRNRSTLNSVNILKQAPKGETTREERKGGRKECTREEKGERNKGFPGRHMSNPPILSDNSDPPNSSSPPSPGSTRPEPEEDCSPTLLPRHGTLGPAYGPQAITVTDPIQEGPQDLTLWMILDPAQPAVRHPPPVSWEPHGYWERRRLSQPSRPVWYLLASKFTCRTSSADGRILNSTVPSRWPRILPLQWRWMVWNHGFTRVMCNWIPPCLRHIHREGTRGGKQFTRVTLSPFKAQVEYFVNSTSGQLYIAVLFYLFMPT